MPLVTFLAFATAFAVLVVIPGPIRRSRRAVWPVAVGVVPGGIEGIRAGVGVASIVR